MPAELIPCGDSLTPTPGVGGEFELECAKSLRDNLPDGYVVVTNVNIPRGGGEFYECDAILAGPGVCDILEMKCIRPEVIVAEDQISSPTGFTIDRVLSKLDHKGKVVATRIARTPFPSTSNHTAVRVKTLVVVPSDARITFKVPAHLKSKPVLSLADTVEKYRSLAASSEYFRNSAARREIRNAWIAYRDEAARSQRRTSRHLGRFTIRRQILAGRGIFEYFAVDEPPCQMEVLLREFAFDPLQPVAELQKYLRAVAQETRTLMKIRHPYVACVIGHFQTGASWVQVSDWFEGERLEELWAILRDTSLLDKIGVFSKLTQGLEFCHEKGVFHRNISAGRIRVSTDLNDMRLVGFDCALDLSSTTTNSATLRSRDPRLIPPEELHGGSSINPRLSDIFQCGVLLYRLLENGEWPFVSSLDYVKSSGDIRPFSLDPDDSEIEALRGVAVRMLAINPLRRPELLRKVEQEIANILR